MPAKPNKPVSTETPSFWDFDLTKKIISAVLFAAAGLACAFLLIPYFQFDGGAATDLILPGVLVLLLALVVFQLARRRSGFVLILLGLTVVGALGGWGLRVYSDRLAEQKLTVLVTRFSGEEAQYAMRDKVLADLKTASQGIPNVEVITTDEMVTSAMGSSYARQLGLKAHADLVIWSWYQANVAPRANIMIEDTTPAVLDLPLPADPSQPQPTVAYLAAFEMRRSFNATPDVFVRFMTSLLNYKSGNYQAFLDGSEKLLAKKDGATYFIPYDLYFYVGVSHTVRNEPQLAIDAYTKAIADERKNPAAYNNRALAYIALGQYDLAVKDCSVATIIDIQYTPVYNTRGTAYLALKKYDLAVKDFTVVINLNPADPRAYHNRALAYQALGQTDFANADLKREAEMRKNP